MTAKHKFFLIYSVTSCSTSSSLCKFPCALYLISHCFKKGSLFFVSRQRPICLLRILLSFLGVKCSSILFASLPCPRCVPIWTILSVPCARSPVSKKYKDHWQGLAHCDWCQKSAAGWKNFDAEFDRRQTLYPLHHQRAVGAAEAKAV